MDILLPVAEGVVAVELPCWLPWCCSMSVKGLLNWNNCGVRPDAGARPAETDVKPVPSGVRPVDSPTPTLLLLLLLEAVTSLMPRLKVLRAPAFKII